MIVYLDLAFLLNCLTDALALYVTARLSGWHARARRVALASILGGLYGVLCMLPPLQAVGMFLPQLVVAGGMVWMVFGRQGAFLRQFLLFFLLSCTMGGALLAMSRMLASEEGIQMLAMLDWRVFFLTGGICFVLLSVVFRGGARHAVAGELTEGTVELRGRRAGFTVLLDTGHTLSDSVTGAPVLTVYQEALTPLWTDQERVVLSRLPEKGPVWCLEQLEEAGRFRLLSYRAVGVGDGLLLCFWAENVEIGGEKLGRTTIALSPTEVSDGGGNSALWGGQKGERHVV